MLNRALKSLIKGVVVFVVAMVTVVGVYLAATVVGERVQWSAQEEEFQGEKTRTVTLVTGLLHADIALEYSPELLERFSFLNETSLPFTNPGLRYLAFGWGSEAFYTTAGEYSDIRPGAVFTAVTGDTAVMRVTAMGDLAQIEDKIVLKLTEQQFDIVLNKIAQSFSKPRVYMANTSIGPYDAFYKAQGNFNIFTPCNQWVNRVLFAAGVKIGGWTPTTFALRRSLAHFGSSQP